MYFICTLSSFSLCEVFKICVPSVPCVPACGFFPSLFVGMGGFGVRCRFQWCPPPVLPRSFHGVLYRPCSRSGCSCGHGPRLPSFLASGGSSRSCCCVRQRVSSAPGFPGPKLGRVRPLVTRMCLIRWHIFFPQSKMPAANVASTNIEYYTNLHLQNVGVQ